ncbi:hypothetical protein Rs2_13166 [Raphanus sativus]|uniref:Uncharacterized protein LOC108830767 n=1 Tax=Raphanus sativus TaxID=3726 RepID=A0A6J0LIU3_RAPSA|nr:uncharacterized protein LOC108830767 [Raphanus sativus]KAJ4899215.1 hypothetical protein Rs2_13166 [Raphanus sativus]
MSVVIKFFILFLLVDISTAYYRPADPTSEDKKGIDLNKSEIDYFSILRDIVRGWRREAVAKYSMSASTDYMARSLFLQDKVRRYVQLWGEWKNHTGYPYADLHKKIYGDFWPIEYTDCRRTEGIDLLMYLLYGLSAESGMV